MKRMIGHFYSCMVIIKLEPVVGYLSIKTSKKETAILTMSNSNKYAHRPP